MHQVFDFETRAQSDERFEIEWAVRKGHMTPDDAEAWARENQRLPFYLAGLTDTLIMSDQLWRLPYAVLWIVSRSPEDFERSVASHRFWKEHVWRNAPQDDSMSLHQAETHLRKSLLSGDFNAFGNIAWDKDYISRGPIKQIIRSEWTTLVWTRAADGVLTEPAEGEPQYLDAFVFRDEVIARWPKVQTAKHSTPIAVPTSIAARQDKRKPGTKPEKAMRIVALMRQMPRAKLRSMKQSEMSALFQASEGYCGQLRKQVEAEPNSE